MEVFQLLDVDSEIFGFPVAKILPERLTPKELGSVISLLRKENVRLLFWASDPHDEASQQAARHLHGFLADKKVTFVVDMENIPERSAAVDWHIETYADAAPNAELENLAVQVGRQSRFHEDPRIPEETLLAMYKLWIRNSVNRQVADEVLVARRSERVVGMATVGVKDGRGFIGLFAVEPALRRKNLGVALVRAAQEWTMQRGLKHAQVVTQGKNIAACRLYEKCDYRIEKIEFFYHFWI